MLHLLDFVILSPLKTLKNCQIDPKVYGCTALDPKLSTLSSSNFIQSNHKIGPVPNFCMSEWDAQNTFYFTFVRLRYPVIIKNFQNRSGRSRNTKLQCFRPKIRVKQLFLLQVFFLKILHSSLLSLNHYFMQSFQKVSSVQS